MPPPPPPGPPPPPMMAPAPSMGPAGGQAHDMLLSSIRLGTKLKKTTTNDKSSPFISGKTSGNNNSSVDSSREGSSPRMNGLSAGPPGLGGLFAGGMPKLKSTGISIGVSSPARDSPVRPFNPPEARNVNRGPPPQPPPASNKPTLSNSASDESVPSTPSNNGFSARPILPNKPPTGGYGKPNVAPRPPPPSIPVILPNNSGLHGGVGATYDKPSPPPKKIVINGRPTRTQSMRTPRSPPASSPVGNGPLVSHLSQEGLHMSKTGTLPHNFHQNMKTAPSPPPSGYRGTPTRPPGTRPPAPPSRPAPPTSAPPPPPPHRTSPAPPPPRQPPAAPHSAPPAPPARNSSMRNGSTSLISELEARFNFHNVREFPDPEPFCNVAKQYNTRVAANAKQQAPAPPQASTHLALSQKMWSTHTSQC